MDNSSLKRKVKEMDDENIQIKSESENECKKHKVEKICSKTQKRR
jgi:hypothetical protein